MTALAPERTLGCIFWLPRRQLGGFNHSKRQISLVLQLKGLFSIWFGTKTDTLVQVLFHRGHFYTHLTPRRSILGKFSLQSEHFLCQFSTIGPPFPLLLSHHCSSLSWTTLISWPPGDSIQHIVGATFGHLGKAELLSLREEAPCRKSVNSTVKVPNLRNKNVWDRKKVSVCNIMKS